MDAWRVYYAAKRHKYLVLLSVMVAVAGALIVSMFLPKYYVATTTMLPSENVIRQSGQMAVDAPGTPPQEASPRDSRVANLLVLAKSRNVADEVAKKVHLSPEALLRAVSCDRVYRADSGVATDMLSISVRMADPDQAIEIANAWADEFVKFHEEVSHRDAVRARMFLEEMMGKSRAQLDEAAADLASFRREHNIADLPSQLDASFKEIVPLRSERDEMTARVAEINARLVARRAQARGLSPTVSVSSSEPPTATIDALRRSIGDARSDLVKLSQTYTDDYYKVKQLKEQIAAVQAEIDRQQRRTEPVVRVVDDPSYQRVTAEIKDLEADAHAGQARISRLGNLIQEQESKLGAYSGVDLQLAAKKREYDEAEKSYTTALAQVQAARVNERLASESGAIRMIDSARSADGPLRAGPSLVQLILSAIVLGLVVGLGVVVAVETLDTRVRTATDAAELLELPVTGVIPSISSDGAPRLPSALITQNLPMSPFAESYRFLATEVLLGAGAARSIMIATAKPNQGGTSTICNLAITLAQAGRRVVLIDADLRRPSLHKLFAVEMDPGLADMLRNGHRPAECMKTTEIENLAIITAGTSIDNPWALLRSARLGLLIEELKNQVDYVLIDVPSAIVFADAATIASVVDGVIVVVRANESPRGSEFQIKGLLNRANPNILGVVLNDVPPTDVDSCHYYGQYYASASTLPVRSRRSVEGNEDGLVWARDAADGGSEDSALDDEEGS